MKLPAGVRTLTNTGNNTVAPAIVSEDQDTVEILTIYGSLVFTWNTPLGAYVATNGWVLTAAEDPNEWAIIKDPDPLDMESGTWV